MIDENNNAKYIIKRLDSNHKKNEFNCGITALDQYLKTQASQDIKKNVAVTYALTTQNSDEILGYYTLSSMGIISGELPEEIAKKLPRYPLLPGILLGRLARDIRTKGNGVGDYLLIDAFKRTLMVSNQIGIVAIIVDAKNEKAAKFYKSFEFIEFPENSKKLFLPLSTIKKLNLYNTSPTCLESQ